MYLLDGETLLTRLFYGIKPPTPTSKITWKIFYLPLSRISVIRLVIITYRPWQAESFRPQEVILGMNSGIEKCSHKYMLLLFRKIQEFLIIMINWVSGVKIEQI